MARLILKQMKNKAFQIGFSLIEVLVAMSIIATVVLAIFSHMTSTIKSVTILEQKVYARQVALNRANIIQTKTLTRGRSSQSGKQSIAGFDFYWKETVSYTGFRKLSFNVEVRNTPTGAVIYEIDNDI